MEQSDSSAFPLDDELFEAAVLARGWAGELCRPEADGETCGWYHGSWQFLRLLKLMATAHVHRDHYRAEVVRMAGEGVFGKVLITGSADYGILKEIADAWRTVSALPSFTILDRCATPLAICQWYGARNGLSVDTLRQDVLDELPSGDFDAVFTHAFMGNFDDRERGRLAGQWAHVLRPGGRVVTVQRVREGFEGERVRFSQAEAEALVGRVASLLRQPEARVLADFDVTRLARRFAERFSSLPVRSAEGLRALFEGAGFRLTRFERQGTRGPSGLTGPSVPHTDSYFLITAERSS